MMLFAEKRKFFPDPKKPTLDGIVKMSNEVHFATLFEAYSFGIFPWPHPELPCLWFCPDERGILDFAKIHWSSSFVKFRRKTKLRVTFNQAFRAVIVECAKVPRSGQDGTWITDPIIKSYIDLHERGLAYSVECWNEQRLVGGVYGVNIAGYVTGESMFFKESNASKMCLASLIEKLKNQGLGWLDIQMVTPATEALGGEYISKVEFLERIEMAKKNPKLYFAKK